MRQGCPLNATLFNAFLSDLEEDMNKEGGVVIGREKCTQRMKGIIEVVDKGDTEKI